MQPRNASGGDGYLVPTDLLRSAANADFTDWVRQSHERIIHGVAHSNGAAGAAHVASSAALSAAAAVSGDGRTNSTPLPPISLSSLVHLSHNWNHRASVRLFLLLDLDKTLLLNAKDADAQAKANKKQGRPTQAFHQDFITHAASWQGKPLGVCVRHDVAELLHNLGDRFSVHVLTAGSVEYGRDVVRQANERQWRAHGQGKEYVATLDPERVWSSRSGNGHLYQQLSYEKHPGLAFAVEPADQPTLPMSGSQQMVFAVDDAPTMWRNIHSGKYVYHIKEASMASWHSHPAQTRSGAGVGVGVGSSRHHLQQQQQQQLHVQALEHSTMKRCSSNLTLLHQQFECDLFCSMWYRLTVYGAGLLAWQHLLALRAQGDGVYVQQAERWEDLVNRLRDKVRWAIARPQFREIGKSLSIYAKTEEWVNHMSDTLLAPAAAGGNIAAPVAIKASAPSRRQVPAAALLHGLMGNQRVEWESIWAAAEANVSADHGSISTEFGLFLKECGNNMRIALANMTERAQPAPQPRVPM